MLNRDRALDLVVKDMAKLGDEYHSADYFLDSLLRVLRDLPPRPSNRKPYEGLFPDVAVVTEDQLLQMAKYASKKVVKDIYPHLLTTMKKAGIDTKLRAAHFISQLIHESGSFRYMEEIASGEAYEDRVDLGNTKPGDGRRYKGRGLIQITGRYNYREVGKYLGIDAEGNPSLLAELPYSVYSAGWFWNLKGLNALADLDDYKAITRSINGGFNGLQDRKDYLELCKKVLGI